VLDAVGEEHEPDPVVVAHRREREHRRQLDGQLALEPPRRAEPLRARQVDDEHHGELALLLVAPNERPAHARRHVPVDRPHLVAGLVLAHLGELHPLPLEHRAVLAREHRVDQPPRAQLDEPDLPQHLGRDRARRGPFGARRVRRAGVRLDVRRLGDASGPRGARGA
jgi:hypothetical protein